MQPDRNEPIAPLGPSAGKCFGELASYVIHAMPLGAVVFDQHLRIIETNPMAERLLERKDCLAEALAAGTPDESTDRWKKRLTRALHNGSPTQLENISYRHHRQHYVLRLICISLQAVETHADNYGILLVEDNTATVSMQNDLAAAERLAAVGKLAAKVAHELNNPLDGILRYLNMADRIAQEHQLERVNHYLQESRKGLLRMTRIVSELLEFSRSSYSAAEEVDLNKLCEESIRSMEAQAMEKDVAIYRDFQRDIPNVRSGNLFQVFTNLIKNAIDAMEDTGGELHVITRVQGDDPTVEFRDNGPGLSDDVLESMFEPFFTTKAVGKGTGLGLAICRDIIERSGGQILGRNHPQGGASFTVQLPRPQTPSSPSDTTP